MAHNGSTKDQAVGAGAAATVYLTVFALSLVASRLLFAQKLAIDQAIAAGLIGLVCLEIFRRSPREHSAVITLAAFALILGLFFLPTNKIGDAGALEKTLTAGDYYPRWFLGSAILSFIFSIGRALAPSISPEAFVSALGPIAFIVPCALAVKFNKSAVILPTVMLSPLAVLLISGYSEYYPFIGGWYLLFLVWSLSVEVDLQPGKFIGIIAAALILSYLGFAIPALALLLSLTIKNFKEGVKALISAAVAAMLIIYFLQTDSGLYHQVIPEMNFGDRHLLRNYRGKSWGELPIFAPAYVLSPRHWNELCYLLFYGGGILIFPLSCLALTGLITRFRNSGWPSLVRYRSLLLIGQSLYLLFMIPRLGPRADLDLFFQVYFSIIALGAVEVPKRCQAYFYPACWGSLAAGLLFLTVGLPRLP